MRCDKYTSKSPNKCRESSVMLFLLKPSTSVCFSISFHQHVTLSLLASDVSKEIVIISMKDLQFAFKSSTARLKVAIIFIHEAKSMLLASKIVQSRSSSLLHCKYVWHKRLVEELFTLLKKCLPNKENN